MSWREGQMLVFGRCFAVFGRRKGKNRFRAAWGAVRKFSFGSVNCSVTEQNILLASADISFPVWCFGPFCRGDGSCGACRRGWRVGGGP